MILTSIDDLQPGMVLGVGLRNREGYTLLGHGVVITSTQIDRVRALGYGAVWIDDEDTRDIPHQDVLSERTRLAATTTIHEAFTLTLRETASAGSVSVEDVRRTLEGHRFQKTLESAGMVERISGQVDAVVGEVLDGAVITGLTSMRTHDSYTYQHCLDVAVTATMIGRMLGYDRETLRKLAAGCILLDIGKIFVDAQILDKPTSLSPAEFARVKDHTVLGYLFVRDNLRLGVLAAHVAYQHHERQDGRGYPRGLTGTNRITQGAEIHLPGRISPLGEVAAIADFHDACSSDRPYRRRLPADRVWQMLREATGPQFNREIADVFLAALPPYPLGTPLLATSGRYQGYTGVVARLNRDALHQPVVRMLADPTGRRIEPIDLDLRREELTIRGVVDRQQALVAAG